MSTKQLRDSLPKLTPTDPHIFFNRREFVRSLTGAGLAGLSMVNLAAEEKMRSPLDLPLERPGVFPTKRNPEFSPKDLKVTDQLTAATHNNFYEFLPGKSGPAVHREIQDRSVEISNNWIVQQAFHS